MTYDEKIDWLKGYQHSLQEERRLQDEILVMRAKAERMTTQFSDMPRTHGGDKIQDAVDAIEEMALALEEQIHTSFELRQEVCKAISALKEERYKKVLMYRYISGYTGEKTATLLFYDDRHERKLHRQAVDALKCPH